MGPHQILQSTFLDILFENRNQQYGAYELRRHYPKRLAMAIGIGLSSFYLLLCLIHPAVQTKKPLPVLPPVVIGAEIPLVEPQKPEQSKKGVEPSRKPVVPQAKVFIPIIPSTDAALMPVVTEITGFLLPEKETDDRPAGSGSMSSVKSTEKEKEEKEPPVFNPVEVQPQFPGGEGAWRAFLSRHLRVPEELAPGERKTILVRFLVGEDGRLTQFTVIQSGGTLFDDEVIRVLKNGPRWIPAVQNGKNIAVTFTQPVTFQSTEE